METMTVEEICNSIDNMLKNYEGCDWCCGGGDDTMNEFNEELTSRADKGDKKAKEAKDKYFGEDSRW
tara:strand:- start:11 stop:211 length:201 start_codon:yes stop_codon:yes gene_type:complete